MKILAGTSMEFFKQYRFVLLLILIVLPQLYLYESIQPVFLFACAVFVYSLKIVGPPAKNKFFLIMGMMLFLAYPVLKVQSVFLLGFVFMLMYVINATAGKTNILPLFVALAALPVSSTVLNLVSFDLRLMTTGIVARSLNAVLKNVHHEGNIIYYKQMEYGVDDVCSGITMLHTGIIMALMLIAYFEKRSAGVARAGQVVLLSVIAFLLILFSNVFRIAIVVLLNIEENTVVHEIVGIASLMLYAGLPFYFVLKWFSKYFKVPTTSSKEISARCILVSLLIPLATIAICIYSIFNLEDKRSVTSEKKEIPGYELKQYQYGVLQYSNRHALLYIKPDVPFYAADHHPRICWKGSGYSFTRERKIKVAGKEIITAILSNQQGANLYSAYWFQHGDSITSDELTWRWNALAHQNKYQMINITTSTAEELVPEIEKWVNRLQ